MLGEYLVKGPADAVVDGDRNGLGLAADRRRPHHYHVRQELAGRAGELQKPPVGHVERDAELGAGVRPCIWYLFGQGHCGRRADLRRCAGGLAEILDSLDRVPVCHYDRLDDRRADLFGRVAVVGWEHGDRVECLEAVGSHYPPESGVLAVKKVRVAVDYEELRAGAVGIRGPGHREYAAVVAYVVELGVDRLAGPSRAPSATRRRVVLPGVRIAALYHKARYDAVEDRPVVEPGLGKGHKVVDVPRGVVGKELDHDPARAGLDHREPILAVCGMRHLRRGQAGGGHRRGGHGRNQHRMYGPQRGAHSASK